MRSKRLAKSSDVLASGDRRSATGKYSDGLSARSWRCDVQLGRGGLEIDRGDDGDVIVWPYSALTSSVGISRNAREAIIEWREMPGAQVDVRDSAFIRQLLLLAPQLSTGGQRWRWLMPILALAGLIVALIALIWHLDLKPARSIAMLLPDSTRQTLGRSVIAQFKTKGKTCTAPAGRQALVALKERLLKGVPGVDIFRVTVIDLPIVNAFAVPGGQMVITSRLIQAAKSPDEVAGILAHEIGHGIERHPEASVIRVMGLQFLVQLISGGNTGGLGGLGVMFLQTGYMRQDEFSADSQALNLLRRARISQNGFANFFTRIGGEDCRKSGNSADGEGNCKGAKKKTSSSAEVALGNPMDLLRTHPYPTARLKIVRQTPSYPHTPALAPSQWQALKRICSVMEEQP